jgi:hypothetical protein
VVDELELVFTLDEVLVATELVVATDELLLVLLLEVEDTAQPFTTP